MHCMPLPPALTICSQPLACSNGIAWDFTNCDFDNFNGWADAANEKLRAQGVPVDSYGYRVYLVPPGVCGWAGLGYVGCDGYYECRAWIGGDSWVSRRQQSHVLLRVVGSARALRYPHCHAFSQALLCCHNLYV